MKQLHLSVDEETAERLAREAARRGVSLSRYLAGLVSASLDAAWPEGYLGSVVGSCKGLDLAEPADPPPDDVAL